MSAHAAQPVAARRPFVVDRFSMNDPATVIRLMTGMSALIYLALTVMARQRAALPVVIAAVALVSAWAIAPGFLSFARFGIELTLRRAGLFVGVLGLILLYLPMRRSNLPGVVRRAGRFSHLVFACGLTLATANWVVAVAAGLVAALTFRRAEASPSESDQPRKDPEGGR